MDRVCILILQLNLMLVYLVQLMASNKCIEFTYTKLYLVLTIFNKGAYLTFKSIFHKALNLF